jgi:hypothetical protein
MYGADEVAPWLRAQTDLFMSLVEGLDGIWSSTNPTGNPACELTMCCVEYNSKSVPVIIRYMADHVTETHRYTLREILRRGAIQKVRMGQGMNVVDTSTMSSLLASRNTIMPSTVLPRKLVQMPLAKDTTDVDLNVAPAISKPQKVLKRNAEARHSAPRSCSSPRLRILL